MRLNAPGVGLLGTNHGHRLGAFLYFPPGVMHALIFAAHRIQHSYGSSASIYLFFTSCGRLPYHSLLLIEIVAPVRTPIYEIGPLPSFFMLP